MATPNAQQAAADLVAPRDLGDVCLRIGAFCNDPRLFIVAPEPSATAARDDFDTPVRGAFIPVLMHGLSRDLATDSNRCQFRRSPPRTPCGVAAPLTVKLRGSFGIRGPSPLHDAAHFRARSTLHTVAVQNGCTRIPLAAGKGSGGRDHSHFRRFRPWGSEVRPPGSARTDQVLEDLRSC